MIRYIDEGHIYESVGTDNTKWLGVTTIVGCMKEKFNAKEQAPKSSKNSRGKWYRVPVEEILQAWENEGKRATDLGHWYHNHREQSIFSKGIVDGLPVIGSLMMNGIKEAPDQVLTDGIYPEHLMYLASAGICGQSDIVKIQDGYCHISDYKTSKEITTASYVDWEGISKKMLQPLHHLDDCHIVHYSIQLSIYMYIILRHNNNLKPGTITIEHIKFVEAGKDKYGYPLYHLDDKGNPIIEQVIPIQIRYMKQEVEKVISWLKEPKNRKKIIKH